MNRALLTGLGVLAVGGLALAVVDTAAPSSASVPVIDADGAVHYPAGFGCDIYVGEIRYYTAEVPTCSSSTSSSLPQTTSSTDGATTSTATLPPSTTSTTTTVAPSTTAAATTTTQAPTTTATTTTAAPTTTTAAPGTFLETFDGTPTAPTPFASPHWEVTVESRDLWTWQSLQEMDAQHTAMCGSPGSTGTGTHHTMGSYGDAVFRCADHVMTSLNAEGYGVIYLTPDQMVNFASTGTVSFDVSTLRTSGRDWIDLWIEPYASNLQTPIDPAQIGGTDLNGSPDNAVHVEMNISSNTFKTTIYRNGAEQRISAQAPSYGTVLTEDAARRDTFTLELTPTHIKFGMPAYNLWWVNQTIPALTFTQGIAQFGHHSYNPTKDFTIGRSQPDTWHWDNVRISPAVPFTILNANPDGFVDFGGAGATHTLTFPAAPANANLRFRSVSGSNPQVNWGSGWVSVAARQFDSGDLFHTRDFWTPAPAGATSVQVRCSGGYWGGDKCYVRDVSVWAK